LEVSKRLGPLTGVGSSPDFRPDDHVRGWMANRGHRPLSRRFAHRGHILYQAV